MSDTSATGYATRAAALRRSRRETANPGASPADDGTWLAHGEQWIDDAGHRGRDLYGPRHRDDA